MNRRRRVLRMSRCGVVGEAVIVSIRSGVVLVFFIESRVWGGR